jgi:hypothetical protein
MGTDEQEVRRKLRFECQRCENLLKFSELSAHTKECGDHKYDIRFVKVEYLEATKTGG